MKHLKTYTDSLHSTVDDHEYSNHHLIRFFRLWLNGDYCPDSEQREKKKQGQKRIIAEFSDREIYHYLAREFEKHLFADNIIPLPGEVQKLFSNERFYNEVKSDFYKLIKC